MYLNCCSRTLPLPLCRTNTLLCIPKSVVRQKAASPLIYLAGLCKQSTWEQLAQIWYQNFTSDDVSTTPASRGGEGTTGGHSLGGCGNQQSDGWGGAVRGPQVLQDALCGSSKALMVCNLSPESASVAETLSSLNFVTRAAQVPPCSPPDARRAPVHAQLVTCLESVASSDGTTCCEAPQLGSTQCGG